MSIYTIYIFKNDVTIFSRTHTLTIIDRQILCVCKIIIHPNGLKETEVF